MNLAPATETMARRCTVEKATALAARGFCVFPLRPGGKLPAIDKYPERATTDARSIYEWWNANSGYNVGISTSAFSDGGALLVVDIDHKEANGFETMQLLDITEGLQLPATFEQYTPTGGKHLIYRTPEPVKQGTAVLGPGVDIRSRGGYAVGSGSVIDGREYTDNGAAIAEAPAWLVERCGRAREKSEAAPLPENLNEKRAEDRAIYYLKNEAPIPAAGERNDTGYRVAARVKDFGVSREAARSLMLEHFRAEPPLDADEIDHVVDSAYRYGLQTPGADAPEAQFEPIEQAEPASNVERMPFPSVKKNGCPRATIGNLRVLLDRHGIRAGYNVISKKTEIHNPAARYGTDGADNTALAYITSLAAQADMPIGEVPRYLDAIAHDPENALNPARDFVRSWGWDGRDWFGDFAASLQGPEPELSRALLWRWMLSAVAAVERPQGVAAQGMLVLCGPQGAGKSRWVESLAPADLILPGALLNPSDRDSVATSIAHWLVELGELDATFRRTDLAQLKAFITRDKDTFRRPYDKVEETHPRRTVFAATVNGNDFLSDPTGNRRYWTIPVDAIDLARGIDVRAVWAQVAAAYDRGEHWHLSQMEERQLVARNSDHTLRDPIEDQILARFDPETGDRSDFLTATEVVQAVGIARPDRNKIAAAGHALREHFGERKTVHGRRGWWLPRAKTLQEMGATDADKAFR